MVMKRPLPSAVGSSCLPPQNARPGLTPNSASGRLDRWAEGPERRRSMRMGMGTVSCHHVQTEDQPVSSRPLRGHMGRGFMWAAASMLPKTDHQD